MAGVPSCWGVDLSGSPWPCVVEGAGRGPRPTLGGDDWLPGPDLIAETETPLRPPSTGDPTLPALKGWDDLATSLKRLQEPIRSRIPEGRLVGVAFPRSTPPLLRQYLPVLFGEGAATPRRGLPEDSPLVGVEAPVALLLEAVARGAIAASGAFAVGCGSAASREWTSLTIESEATKEDGDRRPSLRITLGPSSNSLAGLQVPREAIVLTNGTDDDSSGADPGRDPIRLETAATARGAARFAEWLTLELSSHRTGVDRRRQAALLPGAPALADRIDRPIGLIGGDGRGGFFWRRLLDSGRTIPTGGGVLATVASPPCWFLLAESLDPATQPSRWLTQDEWSAAGLRWHSAFLQTSLAAAALPCWRLELRDFNDRRTVAAGPWNGVPPRWSLPRWVCRIAAEDPA